MNARHLFVFAGLAALSFAAYAYVNPSTAGEGVDVPAGDDAAGAVDLGLPDFPTWGSVVNAQALSNDGLNRIMSFEGFSATPYPDHKGQSIGYGHLILPGEDLTYVTQEQARGILANDVAWAEQTVRSAVTVPLTMGQFDSLVSFCFNVGKTAFRNSTLVRKLNAGDYSGAALEFPRWNQASGQVNDALVARRAAEQALFEA